MASVAKPLALVTGANQGIGLAVARILATKHSYHVLLGVRNVPQGEGVAEALRRDGHEATVVELDLTSEESVTAAVATVEREFGYLDVLVNNAGILKDHDPSLSKWDLYKNTFQTNVVGPGVLTEGLIPLLRNAKAGPPRIVFVSSIMGSIQMSLDKSTVWYGNEYKTYDASKAAVNMLAVNFSRVLDDVGGRVNAVCPGLVKTALTRFQFGGSVEDGAARTIELVTMGKDAPTGTFSRTEGPIPW